MNFKSKFLFSICSLGMMIGQEIIPYDVSNQFAVQINNNQLIWNTDQVFQKLLIDKSSKNFSNKFTNIVFEKLPEDSTYVKSKFIYEFGDYGFDKLSIGLKKHSKESSFKFIGMKKSFFGQYSEFANTDTPPLSLFYKFDYSKNFENNKLYTSVGYFRENSDFIFDSTTLNENSVPNNEFSDFISLTLGNSFKKSNYHADIRLNHISKFDSLVLNEYNINRRYDLDRNRLIAKIHNSNLLHLKIILDNNFFSYKNTSNGFSRNALTITNVNNNFSFGNLEYGVDLIEDKVKPNINYKNIFGNLAVIFETRNQHSMVIMDAYDFNDSEKFLGNDVESWKNLLFTYYFGTKIDLSTSLKYAEAQNFAVPLELSGSVSIPEAELYEFVNDNMLSLNTNFTIPFEKSSLKISHSYNFYDSMISSNRTHIINLDYFYGLSFIKDNLKINGKLSLQYMSKNTSDFSFNYFKNMPERKDIIDSDDYINISLNTEISISDVLLTIRLQNGLGKFYSNEDYSLRNHDLFNPMSSLLTFGIIWEFDD